MKKVDTDNPKKSFYEVIVDAINDCETGPENKEIWALLDLLSKTIIFDNHAEIIFAIEDYFEKYEPAKWLADYSPIILGLEEEREASEAFVEIVSGEKLEDGDGREYDKQIFDKDDLIFN